MLKITMMLGSFDKLLGESNVAQAIDVARIVDQAGLYAIAIGEHVSLSASLEGYPYEGGLRYGDGGRKPYLEPVAAPRELRRSHCAGEAVSLRDAGSAAPCGAPGQTTGDDRCALTRATATRIRHRLESGRVCIT